MSKLTLQLPDTLKAELARAARRSGKSTARFVRDTLADRVKAMVPRQANSASLYETGREIRII